MLSGFNITRTGLNAARQSLEVVSHNIANASTEGYSRQRVVTASVESFGVGSGKGVEVLGVQRIRNVFLDQEFRAHSADLGYYSEMSEALTQVEFLFGEPGEGSFSGVINDFWNAVSDMNNTPESVSSRAVLIEAAKGLESAVNTFSRQLSSLEANSDFKIQTTVSEINSMLSEVYSLNREIRMSIVAGSDNNDLLDKRDLLLDNLSELVDADFIENENSEVSVVIGGVLALGSKSINELRVGASATGGFEVYWDGASAPADIEGGRLKGALEMRHDVLLDVRTQMDQLLNQMSEDFNAQHMLGFDMNGDPGVEFFTSADGDPIECSNFLLNPAIESDKTLIAFSDSPDYVGNNQNGVALLDLREKAVVPLSTDVDITYDEKYRYIVSGLGVKVRGANDLYAAKTGTVEMIQAQKDSASSVSTDEELADMVRYQETFNACAKIMGVMAEMLETLVEMV